MPKCHSKPAFVALHSDLIFLRPLDLIQFYKVYVWISEASQPHLWCNLSGYLCVFAYIFASMTTIVGSNDNLHRQMYTFEWVCVPTSSDYWRLDIFFSMHFVDCFRIQYQLNEWAYIEGKSKMRKIQKHY